MGVYPESDGLHRLFPYQVLTGRARDDGAPEGDARSFPGFNGPIPLTNGPIYHAYRVINPAADARALDLTLTVPRAPSRLLRFAGPDGRALRGVRVKGLLRSSITIVLDGPEVEILGLEPGNPRELVVFSNDDKYAIKTFVRTDDPQPRTIRLEPAGSIIGRIVDKDGKPLKALLSPLQAPSVPVTAGDSGSIPQTRTDAEGRFRIAPLLPGLSYGAEVRGGTNDVEVLGKAFENIILRAGEVRDLGEIRRK
jgi:hypothetical protein